MIKIKLKTLLKPYKKIVLCISFLVFISSIINIIIPKLIGDFLSLLEDANLNHQKLIIILILLSISYTINAIISYYQNYYMYTSSQQTIIKLKNQSYKKLSKIKTKYFDTHQKGEIITRINTDVDSISSLFINLIPQTINYITSFIGIIIMMLTISPLLTLLTLLIIPLNAILTKKIAKVSKKKYQQIYTKNTYLTALIEESYSHSKTIELYNNENRISNSFETLNNDLTNDKIKTSFISSIISPISSLLNYLIYLLIIIIGSYNVINNKMSLGNIYSLIQYSKQLSSPINGVTSLYTNIQNAIVSLERINNFLNEEEDTYTGKIKLKHIDTIQFKNVTFAYNETPVLKNLNFTIHANEHIAIVGQTGSGKSTILNLLMQFYKINEGEILINDININEYDLQSYYNNISYIPQNIFFTNESIQNNLKLANSNFDNKEYEELSKSLKFKEFDSNLNNLANGKLQQLSIIRAILKEHNLLILDESTSNIDSKNEKDIYKLLNKKEQNKTTITIAHKLSTIINADKIIVIKNGEITQIGTHNQLIKEKGEYYSLIQNL